MRGHGSIEAQSWTRLTRLPHTPMELNDARLLDGIARDSWRDSRPRLRESIWVRRAPSAHCAHLTSARLSVAERGGAHAGDCVRAAAPVLDHRNPGARRLTVGHRHLISRCEARNS